jgi:hypothetical protein
MKRTSKRLAIRKASIKELIDSEGNILGDGLKNMLIEAQEQQTKNQEEEEEEEEVMIGTVRDDLMDSSNDCIDDKLS